MMNIETVYFDERKNFKVINKILIQYFSSLIFNSLLLPVHVITCVLWNITAREIIPSTKSL